MLDRAIANGFSERVQVSQDQVAGLPHLERLSRIDDVGGRHPEMHPARGGSDLLGDGGREGDHVVLGDLFDLLDAADVEGAALADVACGLRRNDAGGSHGFGGRGLHQQPGLVPTLVAPDPAHFRMCVALDHQKFLPPRRHPGHRGTNQHASCGTRDGLRPV